MKVVTVKADNKQAAIEKAKDKYIKNRNGANINTGALEIELIKSRKKYLLFGKEIKYYKVSYHYDQLNEQIEANEEKSENSKEENLSSDESHLQSEIDIDGEIKLKVVESGVYIKILPSRGNGDEVNYQTIKEELEKKEIKEIDWENIKEELNDSTQKWVRIAPRKPELDKDAHVEVKVSDDKLKAFLTYKPALGGKDIKKEELLNIIANKGIKYGLKSDKINYVLQKNSLKKKVIIAEGDPPETGRDAELIYHFNDNQNKIGTKNEDGTINYFELDLINNVKKGEKLVTLKKAVSGKEGKTVTGEKIKPPEPKTKKLPSGKNVKKRDDETLVAAIDGQVVKKRKKVNVLPVYKVKGDVDLNVGNIDFNGNVTVMGNVRAGFSVQAEGNIEIRGNASAAEIISGGEVVIHKGFIGKEKGFIKAENNVKLKFAENASINSKQNIIVEDAIMHSNLNAGKKIEVKKRKGLIVGGEICAGELVEANIVGSSFATDTKIFIGIKPDSRKQFEKLGEEIEVMEENLKKAKKALNILKEKKQNKRLTPQKKVNRDKLVNTRNRLEKSLKQKRSKYEELEKNIGDLTRGELVVNSIIHPGVEINISKAVYNNYDQLQAVKFFKKEGEISYTNL